MGLSVLSASTSVYPHECSYLRGHKGVSDPMELELQLVVTLHVGAGNWIQVIWRKRLCFPLLSHLSSPINTLSILVSGLNFVALNINNFIKEEKRSKTYQN